MQQVRPSIWALLSKKRGLKQRLQIAWHIVGNRESGFGDLGSLGSTEDRTFSAANAYRRVYFLVYFFPLRSPLPHCALSHRPGKRWENCWLASMEAEVPLGHSFSPVFGRSWWRSTCQRWAWSHMTLISVGIFALDWPRTRCWKIIHVGSRNIYITMGICALESVQKKEYPGILDAINTPELYRK